MSDQSSNTGTAPEAPGSKHDNLPGILRRIRTRALLTAGVGAALCILGAILDLTQIFRSYLVAFFFWLSIALGCLGIQMLQHVAPGGWGAVVRRPLEAASRTLPKLALLFVPILLGLPHLYPWARPEVIREDASIAHKAYYLNLPFFVWRMVVYFALWAGFAYALSRMSLAQDKTGDPYLSRRMRTVSAVGLIFYCVTTTFASIDWLMSLNPHWYSTIYGVYIIGGQAVSAMSFAILVMLFLADRSPIARAVRAQHFHDFGKMLLAFVMLWAYFAFSQFLVIWAGNLPEEVPYYADRTRDGWRWVSLALVLFHFALPFLLLLSRDIKRSAPRLAAVAGILLVMRWVDIYWLVTPAFHPEGIALHWLDLAATVAVGGIWIYLFAGELETRPLLPIQDPLLKEATANG